MDSNPCSIVEPVFERTSPEDRCRLKLSVLLDRTPDMDSSFDNRAHPRRSQMSTCAVSPTLPRQRDAVRGTLSVAPARPAAVAAAPAGRRSVHLTRRGRFVVLALLIGLALAAMTAFGPHSAASGESGAPVQTRTVEVGPGDTLWEIAADVAKPGQVRDMVHQIEELNALSGAGLTVGQQLAVPVR
jgi:hypothetical protein